MSILAKRPIGKVETNRIHLSEYATSLKFTVNAMHVTQLTLPDDAASDKVPLTSTILITWVLSVTNNTDRSLSISKGYTSTTSNSVSYYSRPLPTDCKVNVPPRQESHAPISSGSFIQNCCTYFDSVHTMTCLFFIPTHPNPHVPEVRGAHDTATCSWCVYEECLGNKPRNLCKVECGLLP